MDRGSGCDWPRRLSPTWALPSAQLSQVPQTESRTLMCPVEPDLTMATRVLRGSRRKAVRDRGKGKLGRGQTSFPTGLINWSSD